MGVVAFVLFTALAAQAAPQHATTSTAAAPPSTSTASSTASTSSATTASVGELGRAYDLFVQARLADSRDDDAGAIADYRDALRLEPNSSELHAELSELLARQGQTDDAKTEAQAAVAIDPDNPTANRILGWLDSVALPHATGTDAARLLTDAIAHLEKALAAPGLPDPSTELTLGQLYLRNKQTQKAVDTLQRFVGEHPEYPQGFTLLADALEANGQAADAEGVRAALVKAEPASVEARVRAVEDLEAHDQWRQAAAGWADIIRSNPAGAIYRTRYAAALANSGDLAGATTFLSAMTVDSPGDISAWYLLAEVEDRAGHADQAELAAQKIAAIDPTDPRGPLALAESRAARDDYKGVVEAVEARVDSPRDADVASGAFTEMANTMATAQGRMGDHKGAIETLERALKHAPSDEDLKFGLAAAYDQAHEYDQAEKAFRDLIAADPKNAEALNYLGYMLAERGRDLDEAVSLVTRALAIDVDNPAFLDSLGWAYFKKAELDKAQGPLERAAAAVPHASVIQEHLGDLYFQMKRYGDAAAAFDRALTGDRDGIDATALTKKRDRARTLAGKS